MTQNVIEGKPSTLGGRLRLARREAGYTIQSLARELNVDPRTVARWQSDEAMPSVLRLTQIARVLGRPVSYFLDGDLGEAA